MSPARRLAAACLVVGLATTMATPSYAESASHRLRRERHRAAVLDARAHQQAVHVQASQAQLTRLDERANVALATLQRARQAADAARLVSEQAQEKLAAARQRTDAARATLNTMAAGAYRSVAAGGTLGTTLSLVKSGDPQAFVDGIELLSVLGKSEAAAVDDLQVAEAAQARAQQTAASTETRAVAAQRTAESAKQRCDALVREQQRLIAHQRNLLEQTRLAAAWAHVQARRLEHEIAVARARAAAIRRAQLLAARQARARGGPIPTCDGASVSGYSNGNLPVASLCPLWGAPGEMLRADAAAAFNRMSRAFAGAFGEPLCVTASYRTYERQVQLYATMPAGYAAVPGTSNHGWGIAVDLCGGIQVDGSPEHIWLLNHAAVYNWFHPAWALPGGPGPHEPWHWEYAG